MDTTDTTVLTRIPPEIWLKILKRAVLYPYYTRSSSTLESMTILQPPISSPWRIRKKLRLVCRYWYSLLGDMKISITVLGIPRFGDIRSVIIYPANKPFDQTLWLHSVERCRRPHCGHPWCFLRQDTYKEITWLQFPLTLRGFCSGDKQPPDRILAKLPSDLLVLSVTISSSWEYNFNDMSRFQHLTNLRLQLAAEAFIDNANYDTLLLPDLRTLWVSLITYYGEDPSLLPTGIGFGHALSSLQLPKIRYIKLDGSYCSGMERGVRHLLTAYTTTTEGLLLTPISAPSCPRWWIKEKIWTSYPHLSLLGLTLRDIAKHICNPPEISTPTFSIVILDFLKNIEESRMANGLSYAGFYSNTFHSLGKPIYFDCSWEEVRASVDEGHFETERLGFLESFFRSLMRRHTPLYDSNGVELRDARAQGCIEGILQYGEEKEQVI